MPGQPERTDPQCGQAGAVGVVTKPVLRLICFGADEIAVPTKRSLLLECDWCFRPVWVSFRVLARVSPVFEVDLCCARCHAAQVFSQPGVG